MTYTVGPPRKTALELSTIIFIKEDVTSLKRCLRSTTGVAEAKCVRYDEFPTFQHLELALGGTYAGFLLITMMKFHRYAVISGVLNARGVDSKKAISAEKHSLSYRDPHDPL